ncbi:MAG: glycoside hydrolase family 3 C-terminal domain-containing protein, partial [Eubacteriales bacterium]|nr:glycoside hydrolase family 3 C-terminal domain-containing protein [Eubacteriales bacterium]
TPQVWYGAKVCNLLLQFWDFKAYVQGMMKPFKFAVTPDDAGLSDEELRTNALAAAKDADYVVVIAGTDSKTASEENDRTTLELPYNQSKMIEDLLKINENTIVVLVTLGAVTGSFFDKAHTVINAHYAGQEQGTAIANVLFGNVNPNAKLTATWYKDEKDLPHINDYGLKWQDTLDGKARTYMYFDGDVLFPFGYGLSYTTFEYSNLRVEQSVVDANGTLHARIDIANTGKYAGAEIVEAYVKKRVPEGTYDKLPEKQLKAFTKVYLNPGETKTVDILIPVSEIDFWSPFYERMVVESGEYELQIGKSSAEIVQSQVFAITGEWQAQIQAVKISSAKQIMHVGDKVQLEVSVTLVDSYHLKDKEKKIQFKSLNPDVITVDEDGVISAVSCGVATVEAIATYQDTNAVGKIAIVVS